MFDFGAYEARIGPGHYLYGSECAPGEFRDCAGVCWSRQYLTWNKDGQCDAGASGVVLNCPKFGCDDCEDCARDWDVDYCGLSIDVRTGVDYWVLGDVFLAANYAAFDPARYKLGLAPLADRFGYLHHEPYNRDQILLAVTKTCQLKEREVVVSIGV